MLLDFIKSWLPSFNKGEVLEDIRITMGELDNGVMDAWRVSGSYYETATVKAKENMNLEKQFWMSYVKRSGRRSRNMITEIGSVMPNVKANLAYTEKMIVDLMETRSYTDSMEAKKAALIKAAECISFISRFSIDLLLYIYAKEAKHTDSASVIGDLSKIQEKRVEENIIVFGTLFGSYSMDPEDYKLRIKTIPNLRLEDSTYEAAIAAYKEDKVDPFATDTIQGFHGSPIYHYRLMVAEWQSARYRSFSEKKTALELRLLNLKMESEGKKNPKAQQEIEYIQERIEKYEYDMKKIEEDVGI